MTQLLIVGALGLGAVARWYNSDRGGPNGTAAGGATEGTAAGSARATC